MPISTIKHENLNKYERILTADHESRKNIRTISYITNSLLIGQRKKNKEVKDGGIDKKEEKNVLRKPSCNTEKKIVNPSSLLPVIFSIVGFYINIHVCLLIASLHSISF